MKHCCCERYYFFDIKKCGDEDCDICLPPRLPCDNFSQIDHLPDPIPGNDGHIGTGKLSLINLKSKRQLYKNISNLV